ncbi:MAG: molybdate ABC transporter permease subunit [Firmicutes bacterium]|nr:molybdate ABC transporter permease subunit [Bacillota bacterium]
MTETYLSPIWISLKTVVTATAITFILGIAAARWMVNYRGRLKSLIDGLFILPMVLPPTVVGLVLLVIFGRNGPIGKMLLQLGTTVVFSWPATVITAVVVAFPLMYLTVRGSFEQIDPNIEDAARTLGASEWKVFWSVTLPLAVPGVVSGAILSFARALGEFGATLMLAGNLPGRTQTIPVAIYFAVEAGEPRTAWVLVLVVLCLSLSAIAGLAYWKGKNVGLRSISTDNG